MDVWGASEVAPGPIFLSAGIARPDGFRRSVGEAGLGRLWSPLASRPCSLDREALCDALSEAKRNNAALGITLKDAVKLCELKHLVDDVDVVVFEPQIIWIEGEEYLDELLRHVLSP